MGKLKEFFTEIAEQAGLKADENVTKFIGTLPDADLPESFEDTFNTKYLTIEAAKSEPVIRDHFADKFKSRYLGTMDKKVLEFLKSDDMPDDFIEKIEKEKDSLQKIQIALHGWKEHKDKLIKEGVKSGKNDEKLVEATNKINELNKALADKETHYSQVLADKDATFEKERVDYEKTKFLSQYTFAKNETLEPQDIHYIVNKKINDLPYDYKRDKEGKIQVYRKGTDELAFENNKPVTLKGLYDKHTAQFTEKSGKDNNDGSQNRQKPDISKNGKLSAGQKFGTAYKPV